MFIPTLDAAIGLDLDVPVREVTQGSTLSGTVLAEAGSDLAVRGCEVALIRTTSYLYRQGSLYGGAASVPTRATEVVVARGCPAPGRCRPAADWHFRSRSPCPPMARGASRPP